MVLRERTRPNYDQRAWYRTMRWARLRNQVLLEAAYACAGCSHVQVKLEVDHIRKHDGDPALFWAKSNLQALCPQCHHAKTQRGE
jgi:5-methylcytosine-specific restriction endonuclease McrA